MKKFIILLVLGLFLLSCEDVVDVMVNDMDVVCINQTNERMTVVFSATKIPAATLYDIINNNSTPTLTRITLDSGQVVRTTIYFKEYLDVWYQPYKSDGEMYGGGGKIINPIITIE